MRPEPAFLLLLLAGAALADGALETTGHTKFRLVGTTFPSDSVLSRVFAIA